MSTAEKRHNKQVELLLLKPQSILSIDDVFASGQLNMFENNSLAGQPDAVFFDKTGCLYVCEYKTHEQFGKAMNQLNKYKKLIKHFDPVNARFFYVSGQYPNFLVKEVYL